MATKEGNTMMSRWQWRRMRKILLLVLLVFLHTLTELSAFRPKDQSRTRSKDGRFRDSIIARDQNYARVTMRKPVVLCMFPPLPSSFLYDEEVVFLQRATQTRISGKNKLEKSIAQWEEDFRYEVDKGKDSSYDYRDPSQRLARVQTSVATTVSPTTLLVRWNATYVDPSVGWLVSLSESVPGWIPDFRSYIDQASEVRKFSYSALARLFGDAIASGRLRVPLACIEGTTTYEFQESTKKVTYITEDLAYAQDLNRGALSNRLCARDLHFFLEVARKPLEYPRNGGRIEANDTNTQEYEYWEDLVSEVLPWRSVPGMMDSMYIEGQSEEDLGANLPLLFGALSVVFVLAFANWVAPNLIGQSLFGPPSYIVPPSELNDIIQY